MAYLLDRINTELEDRMQLQAGSFERWLLLDFKGSPLVVPGTVQVRRSLLEGDTIDNLEDLVGAQLDAAVINLQMAWLDSPKIFKLLHCILKPGARLFFCTLGPDTLVELREAWSSVDNCPHVHLFTDLHHLGDQLFEAGFLKPILDADWVGVEFDDIDLLMEDLRDEGFTNILSERRKSLTGKQRFNRFRSCFSSRTGPVQMTFELIYGYAEVGPTQIEGIRVNLPNFAG